MEISLASGLALSQCSVNLTLLYYCSFSAQTESYREVVLSGNRSLDLNPGPQGYALRFNDVLEASATVPYCPKSYLIK